MFNYNRNYLNRILFKQLENNIPYFNAVFSKDVFKFEYIYIKLKPSL
ncbi:hypothetical protein SAMN05660445_02501 [Salegentibacter salarius]|nr:hypothetical protein SAMN05660445_02501 [Salegentibacter salarius]